MPDWLKVMAWEIKRNLTNKTFLISMLLTPLIMIAFGAIPRLLAYVEEERHQTVYIVDEINIYEEVKPLLPDNIVLVRFEGERAELESLIQKPGTSYIVLDEASLRENSINVYTAQEGILRLDALDAALNAVIRSRRFTELGIDRQTAFELTQGYKLHVVSIRAGGEDYLAKIIPAAFAGLILFSISITGIMTFQSSIQEKKDKMAELLLSSITPSALMTGKVLGYFVIGLIQAALWIAFAIPIAIIQFDIPVFEYLFVPVLPVMLFFTTVGYLMFSALFASMGATIEDIQEAGNFQGMIFIFPWLPLFFIGSVIGNPNGMIAVIASYFPLTSPGVMTLRLAMLTQIPIMDTVISGILLVVFTWLVVKLSGKIFKTGMLMYGKNANLKEIYKWVRH